MNPNQKPHGVFLYTLHKCASTFLEKLFRQLAAEKGMRYHAPPGLLRNPKFADGKANFNYDVCYGAIRKYKDQNLECDEKIRCRKILQVRDPRDILVSQFYSFGWSHKADQFGERQKQHRQQIQSISIDQYVLYHRAAAYSLKRRMRPLAEMVRQDPSVQIVTYEKMVTNYDKWLNPVLDQFEFRSVKERLMKIKYRLMYRHTFKPQKNPNGHKRNVTPGEHREKLQPETIAMLNEYFAEYLQMFGYETEAHSKRQERRKIA